MSRKRAKAVAVRGYRDTFSLAMREWLDVTQSSKPGWEELGPEPVASMIQARKLLQYREAP